MFTFRQFLFLCLLSILILSVFCENITTVKKRRGRPKKVIEEKATTKASPTETTTLIVPSVLPTTEATLDEYETWFDQSGWWNEPNKTRTKAGETTKQRRKFPTTLYYPSTTPYNPLKHFRLDNETGAIEGMYYSMKQHYMKPENQKKADHLVRDIMKKHDQAKGIPEQYTWVSIEQKVEGKLKNKYLREEVKDYGISDI